jgi:superfamily II DNA/RNA helicase
MMIGLGQLICSRLNQDDSSGGLNSNFTRALILVPTRELAEQVTAFLRSVVRYCDKDVVAINVASGTTAHLQRYVCPAQAGSTRKN